MFFEILATTAVPTKKPKEKISIDSGKEDTKDKSKSRKTVSKDTPKLEPPKKYCLILHDDPKTHYSFVEQILITLFYKSKKEAKSIIFQAEKKGKAVVQIYASRDIAETKTAMIMEAAAKRGFPLTATFEPLSGE